MVVIDFPSSPIIGQIYTQNNLSWIWTGVTWDSYSNEPTKPVHIIYDTINELLNDQENQFEGYIYYVHENETYYNYLGTTNGDLTDYNPIGGSGLSNTNNEVKVIYINPDLLSGTGTIEEQICEYINTNITIDYSKQYSKLNIILGIDPNVETFDTIFLGMLYNWYAATDERNIANNGWNVAGKDDYETLALYYDSDATAFLNTSAESLKDLDYWDETIIGNNNSKFNGRGSGTRGTDGSFSAKNGLCRLWNKEEYIEEGMTWGFISEFYSNSFFLNTSIEEIPTINIKEIGCAIRLIKESTTLSHGQEGIYIGNDGKVYRTICIGTQEWLADNLAETKYRNGDDIPEVTDNTAWSELTTGARCFYDNDESNAYPI